MTESTGQDPQLSFDELGRPLHDVTFVVLDLETTGGSREHNAITEVGAVKVRGGQIVGEFATLVDPGQPIPPAVTSITGITDAMVADAPGPDAVLAALLEFVTDCVIVAHNAAFDIGFLRAGCERAGLRWPKPAVVCTLRLARRVLFREETPNHKLATLARVLGAHTVPGHRALEDARATVEVFHSLLEKLGPLGVHSLEELLGHLPDVTSTQRRKRGLADPLPHLPGVYLFRGPNEEVLYVGTATDLRRRVRQYFTAGERRGRIKEMVGLAERVDHVTCTHPLEAQVRELRLLAAHQPRYNRRSRFPTRVWWVSLTSETFPRLIVGRKPAPDALGPFGSRNGATQAVEALQQATGLRRCTERIRASNPGGRPCVLHEAGRCGAPCAGHQNAEQYAPHVVAVRDVVAGRNSAILDRLHTELGRLSDSHRFEDAAALRDRLTHLARSLERSQRLAALASVPEMVAARPDGTGGWQFAVIRHGRLAAAGNAPRGTPPMPVVDALEAAAETVLAGAGPLRGAPADEVQVLYRWLTAGDARLVRCETPWSQTAGAAGSWREWAERAESAREPYAAAD